jgi:hypothetical protein
MLRRGPVCILERVADLVEQAVHCARASFDFLGYPAGFDNYVARWSDPSLGRPGPSDVFQLVLVYGCHMGGDSTSFKGS